MSTADRGAGRRPLHAPSGPRVDDGLFGPGSATWTIWTTASMYVAAYRSVVVQMLYPQIGHGVDVYSDFSTDPMGRLRRTGHYFAAMALGDTPTAEALGRQVKAMHGRVKSVEPITGAAYCALDPELLLYVHITGWHSGLVCHERFNGPLPSAVRAEYLRQGAVGTELAGLPSSMVPTTADEVRDYFASVAPRLAYGQHAMNVIEWFDDPRLPTGYRRFEPMVRLLREGVASTLPEHIVRMTGMRQRRSVAAASTVALRAGVRALDDPRLGTFQRLMVPEAYALVTSAWERQAAWEREQHIRPPRPIARVAEAARSLIAVP